MPQAIAIIYAGVQAILGAIEGIDTFFGMLCGGPCGLCGAHVINSVCTGIVALIGNALTSLIGV
jgi:hypothetical protein